MKDYFNFGYQCLGPLLYGFSSWLMKNIHQERINRIYFFSRDGYIMKKAFDMLFSDSSVKTFYLEVSRRSLRVPILWKDYSFENLLTMLTPSKLVTLRSIFDAVGLEMSGYIHLIHKFGFIEDSFFYRDEILNNKELLQLYKELAADIELNSKKEYVYLKEYVRQHDIHGKFAIVDIGWSGGMQRFLQTTLKEMGIDADIYGYYTGVADYYKRNMADGERMNLYGYLFDFYHNPNDVDSRSCFVGLYEMLFLETKGSVKNYGKDGAGRIYAERYEYEYSIDGKLLDEVEKIKEVQNGALTYVENRRHATDDIEESISAGSLLKEGQRPSTRAVELFANFRFFDEGEYTFLAKPQPLLYYFFHFQDFKKDFLKCRWKTAFLRRMFIFPISYYEVYQFVKYLTSK